MSFRERSIGALVGMLVVLHALPALAAKSARLAHLLGVVLDDPSVPGVTLTFDDGPHPFATPRILDALDDAHADAIFFLVGEQVEKHPETAREIVRRGHRIGVHCHRHRNLLRLTPWQTVRDIDRAERAIVAATGVRPTLYRPPYGILSAAALVHARRRGWTTMLWSAWGRDWRKQETGETIARTVIGGLRPGAIVLLHDADFYGAFGSWENTLEALPTIFDAARTRELELAQPR